MNNLIRIEAREIAGAVEQTCDARELHAFLEVGKVFAAWIQERIEQYGFVRGKDFEVFSDSGNNPQGGRPTKEYALTIDMAKELAMVERNDKGRAARQYFIECEKRLKTGGYQMPKRPAPKKPTVTQVARDFDALLKLGKKLGLDDNAAAISANQAISKLCDTNLLEAMGQLQLVNKEQELYFTPTELGQSFGMSGFRVNQILERAGLQHKVGGKWVPAAHRMNLCRILDTGKSHGSGVPVQQVKWLREALEMALEDVVATPFC